MILAIAISASRTRSASCAVRLPDGTIVASSDDHQRGSDLLVALDETLRRVEAHPRDVEEVRVDIGPGSYTGLRVAITCARFFARFAKRALPTVTTATSFDLTAARTLPTQPADTELHCLLDARRERVYHSTLMLGSAGEVLVTSPPAAHALDALVLAHDPSRPKIAATDAAMAIRFADQLSSFRSVVNIPAYSAADLFDPRLPEKLAPVDALQPLYLMGSYATD